ncbi:MAG: NUDIX hydrolase [Acidimicrobiales bacterium]|nr:NUDIX hydrolase [Acidimicrobiales bacterium]
MSSKTDLTDFPRPSLAVDVAVLTVADDHLSMVLWRRTGRTETGRWALPGSFVQRRERLDDAVRRTLADKCAIDGLHPTQLRVMDDPDRDSRGWVVSVAHLDVVPSEVLADRGPDGEVHLAAVRADPPSGQRRGAILDLPDGQAHLPFDHEAIARLAVDELRRTYAERPDPYGLLGATFTIRRLRLLHEAVAGHRLQKDTFRRTMLPYLEALDGVEEGTVGRPAQLYRRI